MENKEKRGKIKMQNVILIIIYLVFSVSGLVLMKLGGNTGTFAIKNGEFNFGINLVSALGFICYICSFLLYTRIVILFDLNYIVPLCTGIVQVLTLVASKIVFKEDLTIQGIIGVVVIMAGIFLMNIKVPIRK